MFMVSRVRIRIRVEVNVSAHPHIHIRILPVASRSIWAPFNCSLETALNKPYLKAILLL